MEEQKKKTDWFFVGILCVVFCMASFGLYTCTHQYTYDTIKRTLTIRSEVVKDETSGRSTVEVFYVLCTDMTGKVYRFKKEVFAAYPNALPGDSFNVEIKRGIPTKWHGGVNPDTTIESAVILKSFK